MPSRALHRIAAFSAPPKKGIIGHQFESSVFAAGILRKWCRLSRTGCCGARECGASRHFGLEARASVLALRVVNFSSHGASGVPILKTPSSGSYYHPLPQHHHPLPPTTHYHPLLPITTPITHPLPRTATHYQKSKHYRIKSDPQAGEAAPRCRSAVGAPVPYPIYNTQHKTYTTQKHIASTACCCSL